MGWQSILLDALATGWDNGKADYTIYRFGDTEEDRQFKENCTDRAQEILDTKPRVVGVMKRFMHALDQAHEEDGFILPLAQTLNASVHWILRRERYLMENNPEVYANNRNCLYIVEEMAKMRKTLLASPYAGAFDLRPARNLSVTAPAPPLPA